MLPRVAARAARLSRARSAHYATDVHAVRQPLVPLLTAWELGEPGDARHRRFDALSVALQIADIIELTPTPATTSKTALDSPEDGSISMYEAYALESVEAGRIERAFFYLCRVSEEGKASPAHRAAATAALARGVQMLGRYVRRNLAAGFDPPAAAIHALASVYDSSAALLSDAALSSMVATFARCLARPTLLSVTETIASDMLRREHSDPVSFTSVLSALIAAFGRSQRPDRGEMFLAHYTASRCPTAQTTSIALAQRLRHTHAMARTFVERDRKQKARLWQVGRDAPRLPHDVPLAHVWSSSTTVWNALARARAVTGDAVGARTWLNRFRLAAATLPCAEVESAPPTASASPYLTLMHVLSTGRGIRSFARHAFKQDIDVVQRRMCDAEAPFKSAAIHGVLHLLRCDGAAPGVAMFNFLASFDAAHGRTARAARYIELALDTRLGPVHVAERHLRRDEEEDNRRNLPTGSSTLTAGSSRPTAETSRLSAEPGMSASCDDVHEGDTSNRPRPPHAVHISTLMPALSLHAARAREGDESALFAPAEDASLQAALTSLQSVRSVLALCVAKRAAAEDAPAWSRERLAAESYFSSHGTALLNEALKALLSADDMPGAFLVLHMYDAWDLGADAHTFSRVWEGLAPALRNDSALAQCVGAIGERAGEGAHAPASSVPLLASARAAVWALLCRSLGVHGARDACAAVQEDVGMRGLLDV